MRRMCRFETARSQYSGRTCAMTMGLITKFVPRYLSNCGSVRRGDPSAALAPQVFCPSAWRTGLMKGPAVLIRLGYDIVFETNFPVPMMALLNVHPSRVGD